MLRGNGYPERARALSPEARRVIFERDDGRCRVCGGTATQIDHIGGKNVIGVDANHLDNLQAICDTCHQKKTLDALKPVTPESDYER